MQDKDYFYIEAVEDGSVRFAEVGTFTASLEYAIDNGTFANYTIGQNISLLTGQKVYFRGDNNTLHSSYNSLVMRTTNIVNIGGNIMSLLDKTCELTDLTGRNEAFSNLFEYAKIWQISNLKLPATILSSNCYFGMFYKCVNLKISEVKTDEYWKPFRIPTEGRGTSATNALTEMFLGTGGTFTGTPEINTTYYLLVPPFGVNTSVEGNGSIQVIRDEEEPNDITLTAIPILGNRFVKFEIDGEEITQNPYQLTLTEDISVVGYFEELPSYKINLTSNIEGATPYQSLYEAYEGQSVEIRARDVEGYNFISWSDGSMDNPRTLIATNDLYLTANYERQLKNETYYQYRGFIKDQLAMTSKPKSFIVATSDTDKEDLLTKATATINVREMPSNINEGDVLVLYTSKGYRYYQGVINKIEGNKIQCSQMQSFFKGKFNKSYVNHITQQTYIEEEISLVVSQYMSGIYYNTDYTDNLIATKLGGFTLQTTGSQVGHLPTDKDKDGNDQNTSYDMEQFMYDIYEQYGVVCEFEVNFEGTNYLKIFTPTYSQLTIGNNQNAIINISPITTIEETNKLIIFNKNGTYRTTYIARKDGEIVEEPSLIANRFEITNTKIVSSDDDDDTLVASNLPQKMYNHRLTFSLLTDNNIYDWHDMKLGMPLHIFIDGTFFDTILTGREIIHKENQNIKQVNFTCGVVRLKLTDILNMGRVGK